MTPRLYTHGLSRRPRRPAASDCKSPDGRPSSPEQPAQVVCIPSSFGSNTEYTHCARARHRSQGVRRALIDSPGCWRSASRCPEPQDYPEATGHDKIRQRRKLLPRPHGADALSGRSLARPAAEAAHARGSKPGQAMNSDDDLLRASSLGLLAQGNSLEGQQIPLPHGRNHFTIAPHTHTIHFLLMFRKLMPNRSRQNPASRPKSRARGMWLGRWIEACSTSAP